MKFYIDFQCQNSQKGTLKTGRMHILAMKNPSAFGALRQAPDPQPTSAHFRSCDFASLHWQYMLKEFRGPPP